MNKDDDTSPTQRIRRLIIGPPRDVSDPHIFHRVSLAAFLAWVGLGADGLSSSAYGPEEAYKALGAHYHLSIILVAMTALTIATISIAYSNLIEHFPGGGGGYLVATKLLGNRVGVVSGCALLVDYVLTITVSIASGCDQIWSFLPPAWAGYKLTTEFTILLILVILNLRGVRESVNILAPIFVLFIVTHAFAIVYVIVLHFTGLPKVFHDARVDLHQSVQAMGWIPLMLLLLRAYSLGGGTYTGIEAVSNGVAILREPRVRTGKRTMALMATSLAFTAGGIMFGYLLTRSLPVTGKTMNAVLLSNLFGSWHLGTLPAGTGFVILCLAAEAALLFVAAQAGFLDGPRVLANMALDSWMPHRFSQLSDRLVTKNGIYLMGLAAAASLIYTRWRHYDARRYVFHQCLHHVFADRAWHVAPLDSGTAQSAHLEKVVRHSRHRPRDVPQHSDCHHLRKIQTRRLDQSGRDQWSRRALLRNPSPLSECAGEPEAPR